MDIQAYLKNVGKDFREEKGEAWISLEARNLPMVLSHLKESGFWRLSAISGMDSGKTIDVIYHLFSDSYYVNVRVSLPIQKPEIRTVTGIYPGADLFERELHEMLGVFVEGRPDLRNLFLSEGSPHAPLRKDSKTSNS